MLPYLAAAGHNMYTTPARLYLQMMEKLQETNPHVYDNFIKGHHVVDEVTYFGEAFPLI